jgi:hypothetical protein
MKQLGLVSALAFAGALASAGPASAQTAPVAPASGDITMSIHTHSAQVPSPLRFGPIQTLPFNAAPGNTYLYSSRRCEDFAPYNDLGLVMAPDVGGLTSPIRLRHRVRGSVTGGNAEAGTIAGDTTSVRCLPPAPTGPDAPGTGGPETADAIHTSYRATYRRESDNVLRFVGTFRITGGEGIFAGLTGGGALDGAFVCLGALRFPAQPSCAQQGEYADFATLRGDLIAPAGQHDPGMRGIYSLQPPLAPVGTIRPPEGGAATPGPFTAKLSLARATINRRERVLDVLAPITSLASGRVNVELHAAGQRFRFTAPIDSRDGRIRFRKRIPAAQARVGTGILTIAYRGDADTRPQTVRLRAANRQAKLRLQRPTIAADRLRASGTVDNRARGVVRVQLEYAADGRTRTHQFLARIANGSWTLNQELSQTIRDEIARRTGAVHSYTLFTGYLPARIRGEMRSFQVLGPR